MAGPTPIPNARKFKKGQSGNPNGRPPLLLSTIVSELKAKGYERATAGTVADAFETLLNVTHEDLVKMGQDPKSPMSMRIVAKGMLNANGWEVLQAMLDRAHGKAKQAVEASGDFQITVTKRTVGAARGN